MDVDEVPGSKSVDTDLPKDVTRTISQILAKKERVRRAHPLALRKSLTNQLLLMYIVFINKGTRLRLFSVFIDSCHSYVFIR